MISCFQKLERLTLYPRTTSHIALQMFCEGMPHITELNLSKAFHDDRYDGVLRAISVNMHHLKSLNISFCKVDPKAIEYLLPTEDNALGGCPELVALDLWHIENVDVELLKKIILALPKMKFLRHGLLVNALGDLTEQEMGEDTARYMNCLHSGHRYDMSNNSYSPIRYDLLAKAPAFERFNNNIRTVCIQVPADEKGEQESKSLPKVLMCLPKLKSIGFRNISEAHINVLPLLESIGESLKYINFYNLSGNLSLQRIMKTCRNIKDLTMRRSYMEHDALRNGSNIYQDQSEELSKLPVLYYLETINLTHLDQGMCNADMLTTVLQSPYLNEITLVDVEAMSDDVMWTVFSSGSCAALSKVTRFTVKKCAMITTAPLVHWFSRETWSLQYVCFSKCEKIDCKILRAAAENSHKPLTIVEELL